MTDLRSELFRRDGHLLDLALDRLLTDELRPDQVALIEAHTAACPPCAELVAQARGEVELPAMVWPEAKLAEVIPLRPSTRPQRSSLAEGAPAEVTPANRAPRWWVAGGGVLLVAAALLLVGRTGEPEWQVRGGGEGVGIEVYRQGGVSAERLFEGATVHPNDTLGFRAQATTSGHLLVLGVDSQGSVYPCHPASGASEPFTAGADVKALSSAVTLDGTLGEERIIALLCAEPLSLLDVGASLAGVRPGSPPVRPGCTQDVVTLRKVNP
jgi:hypothetical protein